jgi:hypothetical protein
MSSGCSREDRVSPVSAVDSFATAQIDPAWHSVTGRCCLPRGEVSAPTRSSSSWSGCPRSARPCPDTCTDISGRSVPENTRTSEIRPTYGSEVVFTTSASSGPSGSQESPSTGSPVTADATGGSGCTSGEGNARVMISSSSAMPMPSGEDTASTG